MLERLGVDAMQQERHARFSEIRKMVNNDPRLDRMLYKLASDAAYKSFTVVVESANGKRQQKLAQAVIDRTRFLIEDKKSCEVGSKGYCGMVTYFYN